MLPSFKKNPSEIIFSLNEQNVKVHVLTSSRSRRATLRYDMISQGFKVRIPKHYNKTTIEEFLKEAQEWMEKQVIKAPQIRHIENCDRMMLMGNAIKLHYHPSRRLSFLLNTDTLHIMSPTPHYGPLVEKWLRQNISEYVSIKSTEYSRLLKAEIKKVSIREAQSRWGSCSAKGTLSYNWRLVFAPQWVIDYVVAHEVCHLKEMNHSVKFWRLVEQLCSQTQEARTWLKHKGSELLAIQFKKWN